MDALPIEMLQEILSDLTFNELKAVSLVCHRWFEATELAIIRSGKVHVTRWSRATPTGGIVKRKYRALYIELYVSTMEKSFEQLQELGSVFPYAKELFLTCDTAGWLETISQPWLEKFESLHISLSEDKWKCVPYHTASFPNAKRLEWRNRNGARFTEGVTIVAPKLEAVFWQYSNPKSLVFIPHCNRLKNVVFQLDNEFTTTFTESMDALEILQLSVAHDFIDMSFLRDLHRLQVLYIEFWCPKRLLPVLEQLNNYTQLTILRIAFSRPYFHKDTLDLRPLLDNLPMIEVLVLEKVTLDTTDCVASINLRVLTLINVTFQSPTLTLTAPKLSNLAVHLTVLDKVRLTNSPKLDRLGVYMGLTETKEFFDKAIFPFLTLNGSVRKLALMCDAFELKYDPGAHDYIAEYLFDESAGNRTLPSIQLLTLFKMTLSIDFFRNISACESFQTLKLVYCTISRNGLEDGEQIYLPAVQRLEVHGEEDLGPGTTVPKDFPVAVAGPTIRCKSKFCRCVVSPTVIL